MNLKKIIAAGTVACMIAVTGCSSNVPENNQGNRNGIRLTESANRNAAATTRSTNRWNKTNATRSANRWNTTNNRSRVTRSMRTTPARTRRIVRNSNLTTGNGGNLNRVTRSMNRGRISNAEINARARNSVEGNYNYNGSTSSKAYRSSVTSNADRLNRSTYRKTRGSTMGRTIDNYRYNRFSNGYRNGSVALNDDFYNKDRTVLASSIINGKTKSVNVKVSQIDNLISSLEKLKTAKAGTASANKSSIAIKTAKKRLANMNKENAAIRASKAAKTAPRVTRSASFKPRNNHVVPNNPGGTVVNGSVSKNRSITKVGPFKPRNNHVVPNNPGGTVVNRSVAKSSPRRADATANRRATRRTTRFSTNGQRYNSGVTRYNNGTVIRNMTRQRAADNRSMINRSATARLRNTAGTYSGYTSPIVNGYTQNIIPTPAPNTVQRVIPTPNPTVTRSFNTNTVTVKTAPGNTLRKAPVRKIMTSALVGK